VLQGTSTLQDNQDRNDVTDALNAFLKNKLGDMPALATLTSYKRGDGEGLVQNGIIFGTPGQATAIDAKLQTNGYYLLRLTTYSAGVVNGQTVDARPILTTMVTMDDPSLAWTPLVRDIKTLSWKFESIGAVDWSDLWGGDSKPAFIEFSLLPAGDNLPTRMDFWLPKIDQITLNITTTTGATNAP